MVRFIQVGIRSYTKIFALTAGITILILLCPGILINMTYAQVSLKPDPSVIHNSTNATTNKTLQAQQQPHEVKITSLTRGQQVQVGKGLVITGTSTGKTTSGCKVSVIVNGIKPYQNATPTGYRGSNDYSKWSFAFTPNYTSLKEGQNKITAKFSCGIDPKFVSHRSVNVTGVTSNPTNANSANTSLPVLSNRTSYSGGERHETIRSLAATVQVGKNTVRPGDTQTIMVKVSDTNTSNAIAGAKVTGSIMNPSGSFKKKLDGVTNTNGEASYSWAVGHNDTTGRYKVEMQVSYSGYEDKKASKSFKVTSMSVGSSNHNNSVHPNSGNSDNDDNSYNDNYSHPSTIISIPHIQIPEVRIPLHLPFH
jgi:hypothetical protein